MQRIRGREANDKSLGDPLGSPDRTKEKKRGAFAANLEYLSGTLAT